MRGSDAMDFGQALMMLKMNEQARRIGWEKGNYIEILKPIYGNPIASPIITIVTQGKRVPWQPSHEDLLADDYTVYLSGD